MRFSKKKQPEFINEKCETCVFLKGEYCYRFPPKAYKGKGYDGMSQYTTEISVQPKIHPYEDACGEYIKKVVKK